jgi:hypothetical protein
LSFETSKEVLLFFCNKYELDQSRTHLLLSELESIQKKSRFAITARDLRVIAQLKRARRESMYGDGRVAVIALAIRYINCDCTLSRLLLLNRECYERL